MDKRRAIGLMKLEIQEYKLKVIELQGRIKELEAKE